VTGPGRPQGRRGARDAPGGLYAAAPGLPSPACRELAEAAAALARARAPKLSGRSARTIRPYWGDGYFGVVWADPVVWYQESGTQPFTMRTLAGKTIPMWVDDPLGDEARSQKSPKTRTTVDGRRQTLIFRRAAPIGSRKRVRRQLSRGRERFIDVPASYPGAPGRIAVRDYLGRTNQTNVGVRWRHPGLGAKDFVRNSISDVAQAAGLGSPEVLVLDVERQ
jgi:hypothetical protein